MEDWIEFGKKLLPLVVLFSMMGFGRSGKKGAKKGPKPTRPQAAPPRSAGPAPSHDQPLPDPFDPFEELAPSRTPAPPPVTAEAQLPRPRPPTPIPSPQVAVAHSRTSTQKQDENYRIEGDEDHHISSSTQARAAYDFDSGENPQQAYNLDQAAYEIGRERMVVVGEESAADLMSARKIDPTTLRHAIMMREILDLPVALREQPSRFW